MLQIGQNHRSKIPKSLPAEQTYSKAVWKTIKSFVFGSRYRYSPLSPLYLYKRQPDFDEQVR
jgi:hypothetical protein